MGKTFGGFTEVVHVGEYFTNSVVFSRTTEEKQCSSYPGVYTDHAVTNTEQAMVLARGPDGCLGGTHHNILKYFAIALGKRTEHQRPDRDDFIQIVSSGIADGMCDKSSDC